VDGARVRRPRIGPVKSAGFWRPGASPVAARISPRWAGRSRRTAYASSRRRSSDHGRGAKQTLA